MADLLIVCSLQLHLLYDDDKDEYYVADQNEDPNRASFGRPFALDASFDVRAFSTADCMEHYLFTSTQLQEIVDVLAAGPSFKTSSGDHADSLTVLCMVIHRLVFPARLNRMEETFRRSAPAISRLISGFIKAAVLRWDRLLTWDHRRLTPAKLGHYADLCYEQSNQQCNSIVGMIDGTVRKIPAPSINQQAMFNGHKHLHAIKYQAVVAPDGIIIHISKGYPGTTHDYTIYKDSGLVDILNEYAFDMDGCSLAIYGDAAYEPDPHMIVGYRGHLEPEQEAFNQGCNSMRIIVEWAFGQVTKYCSGIDFPRSNRLLSTPVECYYRFAVLLTNIHTCYFGDQTNMHFSIDPPTLHQYFSENQ